MHYAAYASRLQITLLMENATPLHTGNGFDIPLDPENEESPRVDRIVRDAAERAYLPPASVKGVFRARFRAIDGTGRGLEERLFGSAREDGGGSMGLAVWSGGTCVHQPALGARVDVVQADGAAVPVARRTRIDGATGTASKNKLFAAEFCPPGTRFALTVTALGPLAERTREVLAGRLSIANAGDVAGAFLRLLVNVRHYGLHLGRSSGDGAGHLVGSGAFIDLVEYHGVSNRTIVTETIDLRSVAGVLADIKPADHAAERFVLELHAETLFGVGGGSGTPPEGYKSSREDGSNRSNTIFALRDGASKPHLPGSSLMGALRAKFRWWFRLRAVRAGHETDRTRLEELERVLFGADPGATGIPAERAKPFAGLLRLGQVELVSEVAPEDLDSVKVDRFTGGPFKTALFKVNAFPKPRWRIQLYLDVRAGEYVDAAGELRSFLAWMTASGDLGSGLDLGFGRNRGFGWFAVKDMGTR